MFGRKKNSNAFDVAIVRTDDPLIDVRVDKLYSSLSKKYKVILLGWDRDGNSPSFERLKSGSVVFRFKMILPRNRVYYRIVPTLLFSFWTLKVLLQERPKVTHACDVDTAIPCYIYKLVTGAYFVTDVFDRFSFDKTNGFIHVILSSLEEFLVSNANLFITNSKSLLSSFPAKPANSEIIMNCPEDQKLPYSKSCTSSIFRIVFAGYIMPTRGLELLTELVSTMENVQLTIAGKPCSSEYLKTIVSHKNVSYAGVLSFEKAFKLQSSADLIVIPYDPKVPMNRIGEPNKLFDAMMLGVPVVSTICKEIIEETSCGIFVKFDLDSMRFAIRYLQEYPDIRRKLGMNGRKVFEEKFNWGLMEEKLMRVYERFFPVQKKSQLKT